MKVGDLVELRYANGDQADYGQGLIAVIEDKDYNHGSYIQVWWSSLGFFQWREPNLLRKVNESR